MPGESRCSPREIQNYLGRISGPLLDRIDIHVEVPQVTSRETAGDHAEETSAQICECVVAARQLQHARFNGIHPDPFAGSADLGLAAATRAPLDKGLG